MAKQFGPTAAPVQSTRLDPLKCLAGIKFTNLGEPDSYFAGSMLTVFGTTQTSCTHISQLDYVLRRGGDFGEAVGIFEDKCKDLLKIKNPRIVTVRQSIEAFSREQWSVLAPVFKTTESLSTTRSRTRELCSSHTMKKLEKRIAGSHSEVWKVCIHSSHQKWRDSTGEVQRVRIYYLFLCGSV
jgi:hypothetical protein